MKGVETGIPEESVNFHRPETQWNQGSQPGCVTPGCSVSIPGEDCSQAEAMPTYISSPHSTRKLIKCILNRSVFVIYSIKNLYCKKFPIRKGQKEEQTPATKVFKNIVY